MARIRSVHPDICVSETMAQLPAHLERTFVRLWTHCDDHGRCLDNVRLIKAAIYPLHDDMTPDTLELDLDALTDAGLIARYEDDGKRCIAVLSWEEYQHPNRPSDSKLPPPPDVATDTHGGLTEASVSPHVAASAGVGEGEGEGEGGAHCNAVQRARSQPKTQIPDDLALDERMVARAAQVGMAEDEARAQFLTFVDWHKANDKRAADWHRAWGTWVGRWRDHQHARNGGKTKPDVERMYQ